MVCILHYGNSSLVSTDGISFNYSSLQEQLYWLSLNQSLEVSRKYISPFSPSLNFRVCEVSEWS